MKRGDIAWSTVTRLVLIAIALVIMIFIVFMMKEKGFSGESSIWEGIKSWLRFR